LNEVTDGEPLEATVTESASPDGDEADAPLLAEVADCTTRVDVTRPPPWEDDPSRASEADSGRVSAVVSGRVPEAGSGWVSAVVSGRASELDSGRVSAVISGRAPEAGSGRVSAVVSGRAAEAGSGGRQRPFRARCQRPTLAVGRRTAATVHPRTAPVDRRGPARVLCRMRAPGRNARLWRKRPARKPIRHQRPRQASREPRATRVQPSGPA
jgi:hypothetical protein